MKPFDHEHAREKARARWSRQAVRRARPDRCSHCGRLHDKVGTGFQQCPVCRAIAKKRRQKQRVDVRVVSAAVLARLEKRIGAMENYVAHLRAFGRIEYHRGYVAGRRLHRKAQERAKYFEALPTASTQELATMSHAYDHREAAG
ncbi:MAG: hypothetical protein HZA93_24215 [Verrucomicrobia bacterium]|nr:hypothetical protein [Verrucomicrobiota bacterium]